MAMTHSQIVFQGFAVVLMTDHIRKACSYPQLTMQLHRVCYQTRHVLVYAGGCLPLSLFLA